MRALTRIATPDNERELASKALMMSASAIELMTRQFRNITNDSQLTDEEFRAVQHYENRCVNYRFDENGMVSIHASLPPLEGAAVLKSLACAEDELFTDAHGQLNEFSSPDLATAIDYQGVIKRSAAQLRADALGLIAMKHLTAESADIATADRYQVVVHIDADILDSSAANHKPYENCHIENGPALSPATAKRLTDDCSVVPIFMKHGEPLAIGRKSRVWPKAIIRAVNARDQHCQFPGCCASRHMHLHHIKHWAEGGETAAENALLVCGFHHRLIHERQYRVEKTPLNEHGELPIKTIDVQTGGGQRLTLHTREKRFVFRMSDGSFLQ